MERQNNPMMGVFCALVIAALPGAAVARSAEQLRMGLSRDIQSLHPFLDTISTDRDLRSLVYECLVFTDKEDTVKPGLAASWEISKDSREYTFQLRRGVRFHNEKEMTASDIQWSIEYALDPRNQAYGRIALDVIESVRAMDPGTLKIVLREPHVAFLSLLDSIQSFPVVPKGSIQGGIEKLPRFPAGTGPFRFVDWKRGEHIRLAKFRNYWQPGIPRVEEAILKPIADGAHRFEAIRTGDLDLIERVPYDQVDRIRRGEVKDLRIEAGPAAGMRKITFNTKRPPFSDVRVRQAVAFAIDKRELVSSSLWGQGILTAQKMIKGRWFFPLEERTRSLTRARALISDAGYPQGLKIRVPVNEQRKGEFVVLQSQLRDGGIETEVDIMDFAALRTKIERGDFALTITSGIVERDPDRAYYPYYHSDPGRQRTHNTSGYENPAFDRLLEKGRRTANFEERQKIYREVVTLLHHEVPEIPIAFMPYFFGVRSHVRGFETDPDASYFFGSGGIPMAWLE